MSRGWNPRNRNNNDGALFWWELWRECSSLYYILNFLNLKVNFLDWTRSSATAERACNWHRSIVQCKRHFDILNRLGVDHKFNRQTDRRRDGRTDRHTKAIAYNAVSPLRSNRERRLTFRRANASIMRFRANSWFLEWNCFTLYRVGTRETILWLFENSWTPKLGSQNYEI